MNLPANTERVTPFDADDKKVASRLGITLPELFITERYEERLSLEGFSIQIDPDNLVRAYDRLEVSLETGQFGVVFDSLGYEDGPETEREYEIPDSYDRTVASVPFFTLMADPTPTDKEHSAGLTDMGLLLGSKVVDTLAEDVSRAELKRRKESRADRLTMSGLVAQFGTVGGNLAANATGIYQAVPYVGGGLGLGVVLAGVTARISTMIRARHIKEQQLCDYIEEGLVDRVVEVSNGIQIVSFTPNLGNSSETRSKLSSIMVELDEIDRRNGL